MSNDVMVAVELWSLIDASVRETDGSNARVEWLVARLTAQFPAGKR